MPYRLLSAVLLLSLLAAGARAATPATGPVVKGFGPVFEVPEGSFTLPDGVYKVSMDVSRTPDFAGEQNRSLETAARFLNMHARNGVKPENMKFALVVHGSATRDLLQDGAYDRRFDSDNPNTGLLTALADAGVEIYVCAQSAAYMKMGFDEFHPGVTISLSAMSAHVWLQGEGYSVIPF